VETVALILRVVVSLGAVLALVWWFQRRLTRSARASGAEPLVRVVSRQAITPKASVVVMETGGQRFLLGVTEASVNVLHTSEAELPPPVSFETHLEAAVHNPARNQGPGSTGLHNTGPRRRADGPAHALNGQPEAGHPLLAGSVLSPATWRQAGAALRRGRNG
jgi:flagellar protein FliO/FliZ